MKEKTKNTLGFFSGARNFFGSFFAFSQKKKRFFLLLTTFSFVLLFLNYSEAHAGALSFAAGELLNAFNHLLYGIWVFISYLLVIAGIIFDWAIHPDNFKAVVANNVAIYAGWKMVRDFLNLFFILVLLFSAFCTIFQVEKYHIKKLILTIVLMALLVNFSYPISRFIIDTGNVTMYYMLNQLFPGEGHVMSFSANISNSFFKTDVLNPTKGEDFSGTGITTQLIGAIVFTFLFAVTLLMIAILMVIRLVVLGIVIIFSPLGFVANIFPAFQKYADQWWEALFKQTFFGVIMIFMMALALNVYNASNGAIEKSLRAAIHTNKSFLDEILVTGVTMALPIVLLWVGIIAAKQLGAAGADIAKKYAMGAVKGAALFPYKTAKYGLGVAGVTGGIKQKYERLANKWKSGVAGREAKVAAWGPLKVAGAEEQNMRKRAEEYKKNQISPDDLKNMAAKGDAAAAYRLTEDGLMDSSTYDKFVDKENKVSSSVQQAINRKLKKNRIDILVNSKVEIKKKREEDKSITNDDDAKKAIAKDLIGKMSNEEWNDQYWDEIIKNDGARVVQNAAQDHFNKLHEEAQGEVRKRLNGKNAGVLRTAGVVTDKPQVNKSKSKSGKGGKGKKGRNP